MSSGLEIHPGQMPATMLVTKKGSQQMMNTPITLTWSLIIMMVMMVNGDNDEEYFESMIVVLFSISMRREPSDHDSILKLIIVKIHGITVR